MRKLILLTVALCATTILTTACLHAEPIDQETMAGLAAAITKVSAPVHTAVRYKHPPADISDKALLDLALEAFPERLAPLDGYVLKARQEGVNSSVLVCDETGEIALIEDAGCTGTLDGRIWETHPNHPCDYVLVLSHTCPAN